GALLPHGRRARRSRSGAAVGAGARRRAAVDGDLRWLQLDRRLAGWLLLPRVDGLLPGGQGPAQRARSAGLGAQHAPDRVGGASWRVADPSAVKRPSTRGPSLEG